MTVVEAETDGRAVDVASIQPAPAPLTLERRRLMAWAIGAVALLAVGGAIAIVLRVATGHDEAYGLVPLLDLDGAHSLAQPFSALLLVVSAGLSQAAARMAHRTGDGLHRHWRLLGLVFVAFALDELTSLHALFDRPFIEVTGLGGRWPVLVRAVVGTVLAAAALAAYLPFLRRLPRETARRFVLAGAIYLGAAVGLDAVTAWIVDAIGGGALSYAIISGCEEFLEMAGLLVFVDACLAYLARERATLDLRISFRRH